MTFLKPLELLVIHGSASVKLFWTFVSVIHVLFEAKACLRILLVKKVVDCGGTLHMLFSQRNVNRLRHIGKWLEHFHGLSFN